MNVSLPETGLWIHPFGQVFLGLDDEGVIRRILGPCESLFEMPAATIQGMTWEDFIRQHAVQAAQTGLHYVWLAIAQRFVDSDHWPDYLPFKPGIAAFLRPVEQDSTVSFAVHLAVRTEYNLDVLLGENTLETARRLTTLSQDVFRGTEGPLTDPQVKDIGGILHTSEYIHQLLEDRRAEMMRPLLAAPLPHTLRQLFTFNTSDFRERRLITHRLSIHTDLPDTQVYCQDDLRNLVQRILHTLLLNVTAESTITLTTSPGENDHTIRVEINFHSVESEFRIEHMIHPWESLDPAHFDRTYTMRRMATTAQAYLRPIKGKVWVEPISEPGATARIVLVLPRWLQP